LFGLENHLVNLHKLVEEYKPDALVVDPVTNLTAVGQDIEITAMLTRLIDFLKNSQITALFTSLTGGGGALEQTSVAISSLMDSWLLLRTVESASERNRVLYVLKSRGMPHSNQMREFLLTDNGIQLLDVYSGPGTVLTGSARLAQEAGDREAELAQKQAASQRQRELEQEQTVLEAELSALQEKLRNINEELSTANSREVQRLSAAQEERRRVAALRKAD
jgi:circadian clock protein KaiC